MATVFRLVFAVMALLVKESLQQRKLPEKTEMKQPRAIVLDSKAADQEITTALTKVADTWKDAQQQPPVKEKQEKLIQAIYDTIHQQIADKTKCKAYPRVALFYGGGTGAGKKYGAEIVKKETAEIRDREWKNFDKSKKENEENTECSFLTFNHDNFLRHLVAHVKPEHPECFSPSLGLPLGIRSGLVGDLIRLAIHYGVNFAWDGTLTNKGAVDTFKEQMEARHWEDSIPEDQNKYVLHYIGVVADPWVAAERVWNRATNDDKDLAAKSIAGKGKLGSEENQNVKHSETGAYAALCMIWQSYIQFLDVWPDFLTQEEQEDNVDRVHFFTNHRNGHDPIKIGKGNNKHKKMAAIRSASKLDKKHTPAWFETKLAAHNYEVLEAFLKINVACKNEDQPPKKQLMCGGNDRNLALFYAGQTDRKQKPESKTMKEQVKRIHASSMVLEKELLDYGSNCYDDKGSKSICDAMDQKKCLEAVANKNAEGWKLCRRTCGACYTYVFNEEKPDPQYLYPEKEASQAWDKEHKDEPKPNKGSAEETEKKKVIAEKAKEIAEANKKLGF